MLAQILPGYRDFRTPLVTGYQWIVVLWILVGMPLARIAPLPPPVSMKDWRAASCHRKCTRCCPVLGTKGLKRRVVGMLPVAQ